MELLILKINEFLKNYHGNLILNNDDPNVARLGKASPNNQNVYYFHVDKYPFSTDYMKEVGEGKFCPFCQTRLEYEYYQYSHIGKFVCPNCDYGNHAIYKEARNINLHEKTFEIDDTLYKIKSNSIYIIYNFTAAITCCSLYHVDTNFIKKALSTFELNNGRFEKLVIKNTPTIINLAKNPTGANMSLQLLNEDKEEKELFFVLNDNQVDGTDVSWIWDINFENLNNVKRIVTAGTRSYDIAIRIKIAGFDETKIESYPDLEQAVKALYTNTTKKYIIANYTSLQPTRAELLKLKYRS